MQAILTGVLPIFALILVGFLAGRRGSIADAGIVGINRFVFYVALPPLMFRLMAELGPEQFGEPGFIAAYLGGEIVVFALAALVAGTVHRRRIDGQAVAGMTASFSNGVFLALPLAIAMKGEAGAGPALVVITIDSVVVFPLTLMLMEIGRGADGGFRQGVLKTLRGLATNPMLLSVLAGGLWGAGGVPLPEPVDATVRLVGAAAAPCALFALGATLSRQTGARFQPEVLFLVVLKLAALPLLVWWLAHRVFVMPDDWADIAVVIAAMPTGATAYVVARQYDRSLSVAASAVLLSTAVSVVTVSCVVLVVGG